MGDLKEIIPPWNSVEIEYLTYERNQTPYYYHCQENQCKYSFHKTLTPTENGWFCSNCKNITRNSEIIYLPRYAEYLRNKRNEKIDQIL